MSRVLGCSVDGPGRTKKGYDRLHNTMRSTPTPSTREGWPWPDSLDALVAAPLHHELLLEDERVRVIRTTIAVGDTVPLHTHRWGSVAYVHSFSHFIRRDAQGEILFDSRRSGSPPAIGSALRTEPLPPHTVENLGPLPIDILMVELKDS